MRIAKVILEVGSLIVHIGSPAYSEKFRLGLSAFEEAVQEYAAIGDIGIR